MIDRHFDLYKIKVSKTNVLDSQKHKSHTLLSDIDDSFAKTVVSVD